MLSYRYADLWKFWAMEILGYEYSDLRNILLGSARV
jgi:hypothetical protein